MKWVQRLDVASKRYKSSMTIEPMPKSFVDKNLDPKYAPSPKSGERISSDTAKPGGTIKPEINATPKMGETFGHKGITSLQRGGTAQYTGPHKLHKGEQVIATDPQKSFQSTLRMKADVLDKSGDTSGKSAQFRAKASAQDLYEAHGPNGNMIRGGSSAIAPHDKDK